jgi:hypothetical protein
MAWRFPAEDARIKLKRLWGGWVQMLMKMMAGQYSKQKNFIFRNNLNFLKK